MLTPHERCLPGGVATVDLGTPIGSAAGLHRPPGAPEPTPTTDHPYDRHSRRLRPRRRPRSLHALRRPRPHGRARGRCRCRRGRRGGQVQAAARPRRGPRPVSAASACSTASSASCWRSGRCAGPAGRVAGKAEPSALLHRPGVQETLVPGQRLADQVRGVQSAGAGQGTLVVVLELVPVVRVCARVDDLAGALLGGEACLLYTSDAADE